MVFGVWDTADGDDFFLGTCLSENNAFSAESEPAIGSVHGVVVARV